MSFVRPLARSTRSWYAIRDRAINGSHCTINTTSTTTTTTTMSTSCSMPRSLWNSRDVSTTLSINQNNVEPMHILRKNRVGMAVAGATALGITAFLGNQVVHNRTAPEHMHIKKNWLLYDEIGSGAFGVVRLGMCRETGELAAIKLIDSKQGNPETLNREIDALKRIKSLGGHQNIIDLKDVYVEGGKMCLVTELVSGGELFDHIVSYGAYGEDQARTMLHDIANAVLFMHTNGLIHKDLKPENVLLCSKENKAGNHAKLVDFGSAGPSCYFSKSEDIGTSAYLPPELLSSGQCTNACDMWAMGCIMYIMLTGMHPFDLEGTASDDVVEARIKSSPVSFQHPSCNKITTEARDLIEKLLQKDPQQRLSAQEMLNHKWMQQSKPPCHVRNPADLPLAA